MDDQDVTGKKMGEAAPARSPWLVAAGVLGVVVLGLVLAFALDRRFRPTVAVEPTRPVAVMVPTAAPRAQGPGGATAAATGAVLSLAATPRPGLTPTLPGGLRLADSPLEREQNAMQCFFEGHDRDRAVQPLFKRHPIEWFQGDEQLPQQSVEGVVDDGRARRCGTHATNQFFASNLGEISD